MSSTVLRVGGALALAALSPGASLTRAQAGAGMASPLPGFVLVANTHGQVSLIRDGASVALKVDDRVPTGAVVKSGPDSRVVLVFSNGTNVRLGPESELTLTRFSQEHFAGTVAASTIAVEPSVSHTALYLHRGEIVLKVIPLLKDQGSSLAVQTPVGTASPQTPGGTLRIVFTTHHVQESSLEVAAAAGEWLFQAPTGPAAVIKEGNEVRIATKVKIVPAD